MTDGFTPDDQSLTPGIDCHSRILLTSFAEWLSNSHWLTSGQSHLNNATLGFEDQPVFIPIPGIPIATGSNIVGAQGTKRGFPFPQGLHGFIVRAGW